jgi:hypothetical protein
MSVISVARHVQKDAPRSAGTQENASTQPTTSGARVAQAVDAVAQFVPTELIGIYIAGAGILSPMSHAGSVALACICALLIPVLFWLGAKIPAIPNGTWGSGANKISLVTLLLFSIVAFAAWVCAIPGGPFEILGPSAPKIGALTVIVLAVVLPLAARKFELMST